MDLFTIYLYTLRIFDISTSHMILHVSVYMVQNHCILLYFYAFEYFVRNDEINKVHIYIYMIDQGNNSELRGIKLYHLMVIYICPLMVKFLITLHKYS